MPARKHTAEPRRALSPQPRYGARMRLGIAACLVAMTTVRVGISSAANAPEFQVKFGLLGSGNGEFDTPSGVAVDSEGNCYIADRENNRVEKYTPDGTRVDGWGTLGNAAGEFDSPRDVAVDVHDNIYVADTGNARVQKFTRTGVYLTEWGTLGGGAGQFQAPRGVAVTPDSCVYVTDDAFSGDRVQKFTSTGSYLLEFGATGTGDGQFLSPRGIAVDDSGAVYVSDTLLDRVQKFSSTGTFLFAWGTAGTGPGDFAFPIGLAWGGCGLYVVDSQNHRVQVFDRDGTYLFEFGSHCQLSNGTDCEDPDGGGALELGDGQFHFPQHIAVGADEVLFVSDSENHRIQRFGQPTVSSAPLEAATRVSVNAFPNPTDSGVEVVVRLPAYMLASGEHHEVRASVYDIAGRLVQDLQVVGVVGAEQLHLYWDGLARGGNRAPHGVYFVNVRVDGTLKSSIRVVRLHR